MAESFDWRTSPAHITLLETFVRPRKIYYGAAWEKPAIELFIQNGALVPSPSEGTGDLYQCSELGQKAIQEFKEARKKASESAQRQVMDLLLKDNLAAAFDIYDQHIKTIFPDYDGSYQKNRLNQLLAKTPQKLLDHFGERGAHAIRALAGMKLLWRFGQLSDWIPTDFQIDPQTLYAALELFHRYARLQGRLQERTGGSLVRVFFPPESTRVCSSCRKYHNQVFQVSSFPEWPFEGCLNETGCEPRLEWV